MNETTPNTGAGGIKYRKLRIAFSAVCGIASLLLVALWVRSYNWNDLVLGPIGSRSQAFVQPLLGRFMFGVTPLERDVRQWQLRRHKVYGANMIREYLMDDEVLGFQAKIFSGRHFIFHVPDWFAVLATGSLAAVLGIRRPFRLSFSLRTLLIAMALIAVLLRAVVWAAK